VEDEVVQTSILHRAENDKDNTIESHGRDCTAQFLECLESLAVDLDGDDRSLISVFITSKDMMGYSYCNIATETIGKSASHGPDNNW